jgi:hypothetical protein
MTLARRDPALHMFPAFLDADDDLAAERAPAAIH